MRKLCSHLRLSTSRSQEYHNLTRDVVQEFDLHSDEEEDVIGAHQRERKERNWGKVNDRAWESALTNVYYCSLYHFEVG